MTTFAELQENRRKAERAVITAATRAVMKQAYTEDLNKSVVEYWDASEALMEAFRESQQKGVE